MIIIRQKRIERSDLWNNPHLLYVFGDNTLRVGLGGQAKAMRGEPNAFGVATLVAPGRPYRDKLDGTDLEGTTTVLQTFARFWLKRKATRAWSGPPTGSAPASPTCHSGFATGWTRSSPTYSTSPTD